MGIYELLVANDEIRQLALERTSSWEIRKVAVKTGMRTLRMDAWDKVVTGDTSVDELLRVTKGEAIRCLSSHTLLVNCRANWLTEHWRPPVREKWF